jgi:Kef-type K+ transport system membrane component KefB
LDVFLAGVELDPRFKPRMLTGDYLVQLVDINIPTLAGFILLHFNTPVGKFRYLVGMMFLRTSTSFILTQDSHVAMLLAVARRRTQPLSLSWLG